MSIKSGIRVIKKEDRQPRTKHRRRSPMPRTEEQNERSLVATLNRWVDDARRKGGDPSIKDPA